MAAKPEPLVDPKSHELAAYFMEDFGGGKRATMILAEVIQEAIEEWIDTARSESLIREESDPTRPKRRGRRRAIAREYPTDD